MILKGHHLVVRCVGGMRPSTDGSSKRGEEPNPFTLPSEDEIYKMRHRERELKESVSFLRTKS
jgi:hypothetical protein